MISQEQYPFSATPVTNKSNYLNTLIVVLLLMAVAGTLALLVSHLVKKGQQVEESHEEVID